MICKTILSVSCFGGEVLFVSQRALYLLLPFPNLPYHHTLTRQNAVSFLRVPCKGTRGPISEHSSAPRSYRSDSGAVEGVFEAWALESHSLMKPSPTADQLSALEHAKHHKASLSPSVKWKQD